LKPGWKELVGGTRTAGDVLPENAEKKRMWSTQECVENFKQAELKKAQGSGERCEGWGVGRGKRLSWVSEKKKNGKRKIVYNPLADGLQTHTPLKPSGTWPQFHKPLVTAESQNGWFVQCPGHAGLGQKQNWGERSRRETPQTARGEKGSHYHEKGR